MSRKNSSESDGQWANDVLSEGWEPSPKEHFDMKKYFCDADCICYSCCLKRTVIDDTESRNRRICPDTTQFMKRTVDSILTLNPTPTPDQNPVTDSHCEELENKMESGLCISKDTSSASHNEEDEPEYGKTSECNPTEESPDSIPLEAFGFSDFADLRRTRRTSKRKRDIEDFCPVCGVTVHCTELANHFAKEVENLSKIPRNVRRTRSLECQGVSSTYVQVKTNRENRHAAKVAKFSGKQANEVYCPVCNFRLTGTQEEINSHVLGCINEDEASNEVNVLDNEEDDEDNFEEYVFGDQTRVRAISMISGGYRALLGEGPRPRRAPDPEDLNVDVVNTVSYGNPQYSERDVICNFANATERQKMEALRDAVLQDIMIINKVLNPRQERRNYDEHIPGMSSGMSSSHNARYGSEYLDNSEHEGLFVKPWLNKRRADDPQDPNEHNRNPGRCSQQRSTSPVFGNFPDDDETTIIPDIPFCEIDERIKKMEERAKEKEERERKGREKKEREEREKKEREEREKKEREEREKEEKEKREKEKEIQKLEDMEEASCSGKENPILVVESLKEKIKDLEEQVNVRCLICLEPYTKPLVSTACWHVHCEECWLMTMGVKKLCPQCNIIVFPTDLRRIYL